MCFFLCVFSDMLVDEANWLASFEEDLHGISTRFKAGFLSRKPTASQRWEISYVEPFPGMPMRMDRT